MDLKQIREEIEAIKTELGKLINSDACFTEIYETSQRLDKLIVIFQRGIRRTSIQ